MAMGIRRRKDWDSTGSEKAKAGTWKLASISIRPCSREGLLGS